MKARTFTAIAALLALAACEGATGLATELQVINETGVRLIVDVLPCGTPRRLLFSAILAHEERRTWQVEAGCYQVEGVTWDGRQSIVEVRVADGTRHEVPFYDPDDT